MTERQGGGHENKDQQKLNKAERKQTNCSVRLFAFFYN